MAEPIAKLRSQISPALDIAVWYNQNGFPGVTLQRSYKDKNGEWQRSNSLSAADIAAVVEQAPRIYKAIEAAKNKAKERQQEKAQSRQYDSEPSFTDDDIPF